MKKLLIASAAVGLVAALSFAAPSSAKTESTDCKTVIGNIVDRPDSAAVGGHNWANDTFKRTVKICTDPSVASLTKAALWQYTAVGDDEGTFKTIGIKSFTNAAMMTNVSGTFSGHFEEHFTAPAGWESFNDATKNSNAFSTSEWLGHLWGSGYNVQDFTWGWTYKLCNEELKNASSGNYGDITGYSTKTPKACVVVSFKDTCTGTDVTVKNNAPNEKAYAWIKINDSKPFPIAGNGAAKTMNVPDTDKDIKVYLYTGGYNVEKDVVSENHQNSKWTEIGTHKWKATGCASASSTPTPSHSAAVPPITGLPVTGIKIPVIVGTGVLFAIGGVVLLYWTRKRRTEVEFVAE